jgi:hypothetical protein
MDKDNKQDKEPSKLGRRIMAPVFALPSGVAGAALLGSQPDIPVTSAAKVGARVGYNTILQDKEGLDDAVKDFEAEVKRSKSHERKRNEGEKTNAAGDTFKKGGSVKGWGMARGARKAKMF